MPEYVRFDIYLPTVFRKGDQRFALRNSEVDTFLQALTRRFGGASEANPVGPSAIRGLWQSKKGIAVDHLRYVFVLVEVERFSEAEDFVGEWKDQLEKQLHQSIILVTYYSLHVLGGFLSDDGPPGNTGSLLIRLRQVVAPFWSWLHRLS